MSLKEVFSLELKNVVPRAIAFGQMHFNNRDIMVFGLYGGDIYTLRSLVPAVLGSSSCIMPAVQSCLDSHHCDVIKAAEILQNACAEAAKSRKYESAPTREHIHDKVLQSVIMLLIVTERTLADQNAPDIRAVIPLLISHQILPDLRTA
ncbi:hypothetical protein DFH08DRAFT_935006 [Mycena albidolilacea]|uniref:Uncharacterized protein n=1 Tax=Mycena albidolilacea TaxID=1033008 RepID=A0AAD7ETK6_9AGAR|nr:hypothetical protein DFH08DRAFT_935006 [Mycena albidolilacea]